MNKNSNKNKDFYGITSIGEKGQVVIPVKLRKELNLSKGESMLVFNMNKEVIILCKMSKLKLFANNLSNKLKTINKVIKEK